MVLSSEVSASCAVKPSVRAAAEESALVFIGKVTKITPAQLASAGYPVTVREKRWKKYLYKTDIATFEVTQAFKGVEGQTIDIATSADGDAGYKFEGGTWLKVGESYVVYAEKRKLAGTVDTDWTGYDESIARELKKIQETFPADLAAEINEINSKITPYSAGVCGRTIDVNESKEELDELFRIFPNTKKIREGAQTKPFENFQKAVKAERGGFAGNKESLSKVFNEERLKLGNHFESELWQYLEDDPEKHYWIALFLDSKSYLHGNSPLPQLAFMERTRALELLGNDKKSRGRRVSILRELAIASKLNGNQDQASRFRDEAEELAGDPELIPYIAGGTPYDLCVYENLDGSISSCNENPLPVERIITGGWLNSRALELPQPIYPASLQGKQRTKAKVDVRIMIGTDGNVISAEVIRGPVEFHTAAIEAAKNAKFAPMSLSGLPARVSAWLSFAFEP